MNKKSLLVIVAVLASCNIFSQTLFTYGNYSVSAPEFLRAYNKNNTQVVTNKAKAVKDYLDLYINSRLKIREAYERGYDTLPQIKMEVENLRNQIIESYMSDPETMDRLVKEAFSRSQKDIHTGLIFISTANGDTATALTLANSIYNRLQKGEDFFKIAAQSSQAPGAATNKGDIGWITAFTLPYTFESAVYALAPGKNSPVVRTRSGYYIFKNLGERKALGKMKAKQILLAIPPGTDEAGKKLVAKKADSLYKRIVAGENFEKLAMGFSNDYMTSVTGGSMSDFGIGQYESNFETQVWALTKNNAVTKPFLTSHGYHIVKRINTVPVSADPKNKYFEQELKQKINADQRWKISREIIHNKVIKQAGFKTSGYDMNALIAFTDSTLDRLPLGIGRSINPGSPLFTIGDTTAKASDWITFAQAFRYKMDGTGRKPYNEVMDDFVHSISSQYYRDHLESFNEEFRYQMNEFKDGNLFFEIMQQEIWNRAHTDSAELLSLYQTNQKKYVWGKSADAVVFFCSDQQVAKTMYDQLKKNPAKWKTLAETFAEKVVADSARYEWSQLPDKNKSIPVNGMVTAPVVNATDNTASFAYIIKTYARPSQRTYAEAKGLVINDYQNLLEEQWIKKLKEKYPVMIDQKVLESITK